ncbi:MAG: hypothetical protein QOF73_2778 [Thermomicrobiales bacterium]|jgi:hypothetical protein|nr:hypothetical protein [Thermomicrobiales bacterium]
MRRRRVLSLGLGVFGAALLVAAGTLWRIEVRHSAPFGFSKTIDFARLIAVRGGYVSPNYNNFDRLDLDLRAYAPGAVYDLTIHIRPAVPGAADIRTLRFSLPYARISHQKSTFGDPFLTVRFPAIADSAGRTYYVWVEPGIRNRDQVVALWSIKSYSHVRAWSVVAAFVDEAPKGRMGGAVRVALFLLLGALVISSGWCLSRLVAASMSAYGEPDQGMMRWHRHETDGIQ